MHKGIAVSLALLAATAARTALGVAPTNDCVDPVDDFDASVDYMAAWRTALVFRYADYIGNITVGNNYVTADIYQTDYSSRGGFQPMAFVLCGTKAPESVTAGRTSVFVPVKTFGETETPQFGHVERLGQLAKLVAFETPGYVVDDDFQRLVSSGNIKGFACDASVTNATICASWTGCSWSSWTSSCSGANITRLNEIAPSVLFTGPLQYGTYDLAKMPKIPVPGALEDEVLGLAEYVKLYALVTMRSPKVAVNMFEMAVASYEMTKSLASKATRRPLVWVGYPYGSTWYYTKTKTYTARLLEDAGADYIFQRDTLSKLPQSLQRNMSIGSCPATDKWMSVFYAADADFWYNNGLGADQTTTSQMLASYNKTDIEFKLWRSVRCGSVIATNKLAAGPPYFGNPIFSEGPATPDIMLKDLVKILHPEVTIPHEPVYLRVLDRENAPWPDDCPMQSSTTPAAPPSGKVRVNAVILVSGVLQHEFMSRYTTFRAQCAADVEADSATDLSVTVVSDEEDDDAPAVRIEMHVVVSPSGRSASKIIEHSQRWLSEAMKLPDASKATFATAPYLTGEVPEDKRLSGGAIAGIVIGSVAGAVILACVAGYAAYRFGWRRGYESIDDKNVQRQPQPAT
eukprot:m51a1_g5975 hypothetical protein (629) ;mRNA; f:239565-241737